MSMQTEPTRATEPRWWFILYSFGLGCVLAAAAWLGGHDDLAWFAVPWLTLGGVALAFTPYGRLRDASKDERENAIDREAALYSYYAVVIVVLGGWAWTLLTGRISPEFTLIGAVAGSTYLGALALLSRRR